MLKKNFTLLIFLSSFTITAQKYTAFSFAEIMRISGDIRVLDNTYDWIGYQREGLQQFGIGIDRKYSEHLSFGVALSYSSQKSALVYEAPMAFYRTFHVFTTNYIGLKPNMKYILPFKFKGVYWKNGVSFYRFLSSQKRIEDGPIIVSKESFQSDALNKNIFNFNTELGIKFPLLVRYKPIRLEGEVGIQMNTHINDFIENDSNNFFERGIYIGLNIVFNNSKS